MDRSSVSPCSKSLAFIAWIVHRYAVLTSSGGGALMCTRASVEQSRRRAATFGNRGRGRVTHSSIIGCLTDRRVDIIIQCLARAVCSRCTDNTHRRPRSVRVNKKADTPSYVARNLYVNGYALSYVSVRVACICDAAMWLRRRLRAHQRNGSSVGVCHSARACTRTPPRVRTSIGGIVDQ